MANSRLILFVAVSLPIIVLAFFGVRAGGEYYLLKKEPPISVDDTYRQKIAVETSAYDASKLGMVFLKTDKIDLAELAFEKSTSLDANWRDGWLWKGYTELKMAAPQKALDSLRAAEKIDPVYPFTYQLLANAYQKLGNTTEAKLAVEKQQYLSKK
jgi:predicted Zn-dependent protease